MRATGIMRRVDELGRVAIPKEIRRSLGIREGTPVEIFVDKEMGGVVFIPYESDLIQQVENIASRIEEEAKDNGEYELSKSIKAALLNIAKIMKDSESF